MQSQKTSKAVQKTARKATYQAAIGAAVLAVLAGPAWALEGQRETYDDWTYACDNSGTCRVAGYQKMDERLPASVLLTRAAGADAPLTGELAVLTEDDTQPLPAKVSLHVAGQALGEVDLGAAPPLPGVTGKPIVNDGRGKLSAEQTKALAQAIVKDPKADVHLSADGKTWRISAQGAAAALLAAESFQKRIGTPSSIASPGQNQSAVLQPQPLPVVQRAAVLEGKPQIVPPTQPEYAQVRQLLAQADEADSKREAEKAKKAGLDSADALFACTFLRGDTQDRDTPPTEDDRALLLHKLDADNTLAIIACERGLYSTEVALARLSADLKTVRGYWRTFIAGSEFDPRNLDAYDAGELQAGSLGSSCSWHETWVWDGQDMVRASIMNTGLCRGFPGGAWELPQLRSEIRPAKNG